MTRGAGHHGLDTDRRIDRPIGGTNHRREAVGGIAPAMAIDGVTTCRYGVITEVGGVIVYLQKTVTMVTVVAVRLPRLCPVVHSICSVSANGVAVGTGERQLSLRAMSGAALGRGISVDSTGAPGVGKCTVTTVTLGDNSTAEGVVRIGGPLVGPIGTGSMASGCTTIGSRVVGNNRRVVSNYRIVLHGIIDMASRRRGGVASDAVSSATVKIIIVTFASYGRRQDIIVQT